MDSLKTDAPLDSPTTPCSSSSAYPVPADDGHEDVLAALKAKSKELSLNLKVVSEVEEKKKQDFVKARTAIRETFAQIQEALRLEEEALVKNVATMEKELGGYLQGFRKTHEGVLAEIKELMADIKQGFQPSKNPFDSMAAKKRSTDSLYSTSHSLGELLNFSPSFEPPKQASVVHTRPLKRLDNEVQRLISFDKEESGGTKQYYDLRMKQELQKCGSSSKNSPSPFSKKRPSKTNEIKIVLVGDGGTGKTSMIMKQFTEEPLSDYGATLFEVYQHPFACEGVNVDLVLYDTAGEEDYRKLTSCFYGEADVILLCFDISSKDSLHNAKEFWLNEIRLHVEAPVILLVGTHADLRTVEGRDCIPYRKGAELASVMGAVGYYECSALTGEGLRDVFRAAVEATGRLVQMRARRGSAVSVRRDGSVAENVLQSSVSLRDKRVSSVGQASKSSLLKRMSQIFS